MAAGAQLRLGSFQLRDLVELAGSAVSAAATAPVVNVTIASALLAELLSAGLGDGEIFEVPRVDHHDLQRAWVALAHLRNALFHPGYVSSPEAPQKQPRKSLTTLFKEALDRESVERQELEAESRALQGVAVARWALANVVAVGRYELLNILKEDVTRRRIVASAADLRRLHRLRDGGDLERTTRRAKTAKSFDELLAPE